VVVPIAYWTILISSRTSRSDRIGVLILPLFLCLFGGRGSCWSRKSVFFVRNVLHGLGLDLHRSEKAPIAGLDAFVRVKDDNIGAATVAYRLDNTGLIPPTHSGGNDRICARLKTDISASNSGLRGRTRSCLTFLERSRRDEFKMVRHDLR
jgi:hypothetical protein